MVWELQRKDGRKIVLTVDPGRGADSGKARPEPGPREGK
jgi:hypothetical protein